NDIPIWDISLDQWEDTVHINLTSYFLYVREYLILIGSVAGKFGRANHIDYATAKGVHTAFQGRRSTFDVTFKLAQKDPSGRPTTGIVYHPAKNGYATNNFNSDLDIYGNGVLTSSGVAWYPDSGMSNANLARIVYNGRYLYGNTNDEFSSVLTHEFGHWLNLFHTFEHGCVNSSEGQCDRTGDRVCDTPQTVGNQGCKPVHNCLGQLVNGENYMDYSGAYGCYRMFTVGQVARMEAAMQHPARKPLWQPQNLIATGVAGNN
ncbi:unnamed protein product, partial [Rotaria sp. Silwood1]